MSTTGNIGIGPGGVSVGFGFGGGGDNNSPYSISSQSSFGQGGSGSSNQNQAIQYPDQVWGAQAPYFQNLYANANQMMQGGGNQGMAQDLFQQGLGGFDQMMNPGVNPHLQAYAGDVQQNFENQILPSIGSNAQGFGQFGGTRQGVAEGVAAGYANRDITNMGAKLYGEDMNRMLGAMGMMPEYGAFGMSIPWFGMNQMAGIMGQPTVLGQGGMSSGEGSASAFDISGSEGRTVSSPDRWWTPTVADPGFVQTQGGSEPSGGGPTDNGYSQWWGPGSR